MQVTNATRWVRCACHVENIHNFVLLLQILLLGVPRFAQARRDSNSALSHHAAAFVRRSAYPIWSLNILALFLDPISSFMHRNIHVKTQSNLQVRGSTCHGKFPEGRPRHSLPLTGVQPCRHYMMTRLAHHVERLYSNWQHRPIQLFRIGTDNAPWMRRYFGWIVPIKAH